MRSFNHSLMHEGWLRIRSLDVAVAVEAFDASSSLVLRPFQALAQCLSHLLKALALLWTAAVGIPE